MREPDIYAPVYEYVRSIPSGRVATYGQVAASIQGVTLSPRDVGAAMRYAPDDVPWHRVVGAGGRLPIGKRSAAMHVRQRQLLEAEGVEFSGGADGAIDMDRFQWQGASSSQQGSLF